MPAPGAILNLTLQFSLRVVPKVVDSNGRNVLITLRMLRQLFFYDYFTVRPRFFHLRHISDIAQPKQPCLP